jgi:hypothetical protein
MNEYENADMERFEALQAAAPTEQQILDAEARADELRREALLARGLGAPVAGRRPTSEMLVAQLAEQVGVLSARVEVLDSARAIQRGRMDGHGHALIASEQQIEHLTERVARLERLLLGALEALRDHGREEPAWDIFVPRAIEELRSGAGRREEP